MVTARTSAAETPVKVLATLKKLMALQERAGTTAEAANAAARIQKLLFKYNLTLAQVDAHEAEEQAPYLDTTFTLGGGKFHITWHRRLMHVLAKHNFCDMIQYRSSAKVGIVGQAHNTAVVTHLYGYLSTEIKRLGLLAMRRECGDPRPAVQGQFVRAFCLGAVDEIHNRLYRQRQQDATASPSSTALVVQTDAMLKAAMDRFHGDAKKGQRRAAAGDTRAYRLGQQAGAHISLARPLGTGSQGQIGGR